MLAHAHSEYPNECCGLLAGKEGQVTHHYKITNIIAMEDAGIANFDDEKVAHLKHLSPGKRAEVAFVMDAREMSLAIKDMRSHQIELQVIYHSHPHGPPYPSPTDIKIASDFASIREVLNLPEPRYVIITLENRDHPVVNAFRIVEGKITQETFKVI